MKQSGYTIMEVLVTVGMVGILTGLSSFAYVRYIPKVQSSESLSMINAEKAKVLKNMTSGTCTSGVDVQVGKYGTLTISGTYRGVQQSNCPTGCEFTYTFNNDVSAQLKGKTIHAALLSSGSIAKINATTTAPSEHLPRVLNALVTPTAEQCAVTQPQLNEGWGDITNPIGFIGELIGLPGSGNGTQPGNGNGNGNENGGDSDNPSQNPPDDDNPPGGGNNSPGGDDSPGGGEDPPESTDPRQQKINDVARRLSTGREVVIIEPQGFDFTVVAKPKSHNGAKVCSDSLDVKGDEYIVRIGADRFYDEQNNYSTRNQFAFFNEVATRLSIQKATTGKYQVDKKILAYNPCTIAVVNESPRRPSLITNEYNVLANGGLRFVNYGYIMGRGGNGPVMRLQVNTSTDLEEYTYQSDADDGEFRRIRGYYLNIFPYPLNMVYQTTKRKMFLDDYASNEYSSEALDIARWGDRTIMQAEIRGGVALLNQNANYTIDFENYGRMQAGVDGPSLLMSANHYTAGVSDPTNMSMVVGSAVRPALNIHPQAGSHRRNGIGWVVGAPGIPYGEPPVFSVNGKLGLTDNDEFVFRGANYKYKDMFKSVGRHGLHSQGEAKQCVNVMVNYLNGDISTPDSEKFTDRVEYSSICNNFSNVVAGSYGSTTGFSDTPRAVGKFNFLKDNHYYSVGMIPRTTLLPTTIQQWLTIFYTKFDRSNLDHCISGNSENKYITKSGRQVNCFWRGMQMSAYARVNDGDINYSAGSAMDPDLRIETYYRRDRTHLISYPGMGNFDELP